MNNNLEEVLNKEEPLKNPDRREFVRQLLEYAGLTTLAVTASSFGISGEAEAQTSQKAFLYDVNLSSFGAWRDKTYDRRKVDEERQRILALLNPQWKRFLKSDSSRMRHTFYLDVKTIAQHADRIVAAVKQSGIKGAYKKQKPVNFDPNKTAGIFANVLVDRDIGTTVREISTAYTPKNVQTTTSTLMTEVYHGRYPKPGELAPFQVRFLKFALRTGMKEGIDYYRYILQPGQTFHSLISTYTQGNYSKNFDAVLKFNSIKSAEVSSLSSGTTIFLPREIYKDLLQPNVVEEKAPGKYVFVPTPRPADSTETPAEAAEREAAKSVSIPELRESANSYIDDVIGQNLIVLARTEMPAVLTESFNIRNWRQRKFYGDDGNLKKLAQAYGRGILSYLQTHPYVTKVITDNGHGQSDPGAADNPKNPTVHEGDFTGKIQKYLSEFLRSERDKLRMKFEVLPLNYTGGGRQRARLEWYVEEANRINKTVNGKDDSVYVSIHINSARSDFEPPPQVRVHGRGRQPKSRELGVDMLSFAVPFYQNHFR